MITQLRITNFPPFASVDVPLSPLTVVIGDNNSGKSRFLRAIKSLIDDGPWAQPAKGFAIEAEFTDGRPRPSDEATKEAVEGASDSSPPSLKRAAARAVDGRVVHEGRMTEISPCRLLEDHGYQSGALWDGNFGFYTTLLVEEPERGVHQGNMNRVIARLNALLSTGVQIIITTHSPLLLAAIPDDAAVLTVASAGIVSTVQATKS